MRTTGSGDAGEGHLLRLKESGEVEGEKSREKKKVKWIVHSSGLVTSHCGAPGTRQCWCNWQPVAGSWSFNIGLNWQLA